MKKIISFFLLLALMISAKAQYTRLVDYTDWTIGSHPYGDIISDGTYFYGMTRYGGTSYIGSAFKIKISDNTYTKILDCDSYHGGNPNGSFITDGTYLYGMAGFNGANNKGTIFKIKTSDDTYTKMMDFTTVLTGNYTWGTLLSDGTYLYGMAPDGGTNDYGTVFKIKISDNTFTKIFDFAGNTSGRYPYGSLISDGIYLYGMTCYGGSSDSGTVFKIKISDNTYTKILNFAGTINGSNPIGSLISDGTYLYGMTRLGGANSIGTVFKIKISDNTYTKILDFAGATNGSNPWGSLFSDGTYLYGMTRLGGTNDLGTAFKIKISDNSYTKFMDFTGATNGSEPFGSFTTDGTYLYGTTATGGSANLGTVFKHLINYSEINVSGNSVSIVDGDITPSTADYTDYGYVPVSSNLIRTYTISNSGNLNLAISAITTTGPNPALFTVAGITLPATLLPGGNTTFTVTYLPNTIDNHLATINIASNDADESTFNFDVSGTSKSPQTINFSTLSSKTYGDGVFSVSATGGASGNPVTFTSSDTAIATCTGTNGTLITVKKAGNCDISANQAGNANYNAATQIAQALTVNPKQITVTVEPKAKFFGDADPLFTYTYTPALVSGDNFSGDLTRIAGECGGCVFQIQQGTLSLSPNYTINFVPEDLTTNKMPITVTANTGQSKTYGTMDPSSYSYSVTGTLVGTDDFSGELSRVAGENVGPYAIQRGTLTLNSNYNLTFASANFEITGKPIIVTADAAQTKVYGSTDPVYTYTTDVALESGDNFTGSLSRITGENVGPYAIQQGTLALNSNYNLTFASANFQITAKSIMVTADASQTKVYGATDPTFTYSSDVPLVSGDSYSGSLSRTTGENVGPYTIEQGTLALSSNYNLTFAGANFEITAKPIMVTADASQTKVYGVTDPTFTYSSDVPLVIGDSYSGSLSRTTGENVGPYAIEQGTLALSSNYNLTFAGSNFEITKATPELTWSTPADIIVGTALSNVQLNANANINGLYVYTPDLGAILPIGNAQELNVVFTPSDVLNYNNANKSVMINVLLDAAAVDLETEKIAIYPNPTTGMINLSGLDQNAVITITDVTGKLIDRLFNQTLQSKKQIDISNYKSGIYIISIQTAEKCVFAKMVKE